MKTLYKPLFNQLNPPKRLLCGPGPSNAHPRVYQALSTPQIGHLDPDFIKILEETKELIRYVWQTKNEFTIPVSGCGSAAWEACVANLMNKNDKCLVAVNGYFGERHLDMCSRYGIETVKMSKDWGKSFDIDEIQQAIKTNKPTVFFIVHAETSTGVVQNLEGIGKICHDNNCLFMVDAVTSTGGTPLFVDEMQIDAIYAGGQKCLSCPPGISMLSFSNRAVEKMMSIENLTPNWYLDMKAIRKYLLAPEGVARVYHHTAPISMIYALRESLMLLTEEGLENSWIRHEDTASMFCEGIEKFGLKLHVQKKERLNSLITVKIPDNVDGNKVVLYLREKYNIEIGGGLGILKNKVWRIGLMGYNSNIENVILLLSALFDATNVYGSDISFSNSSSDGSAGLSSSLSK